jgi:hypothetical protein
VVNNFFPYGFETIAENRRNDGIATIIDCGTFFPLQYQHILLEKKSAKGVINKGVYIRCLYIEKIFDYITNECKKYRRNKCVDNRIACIYVRKERHMNTFFKNMLKIIR